MAEVDGVAEPTPIATPSYDVACQVVDLDVDFKARKVFGKTEITIHPQSKDLKTLTLSLRQCRITRLTVNGKSVSRMQYTDPYTKTGLAAENNVHQHHLRTLKLATAMKMPPDGELIFDVPKQVHIEELNLQALSINPKGSIKATSGDALGSALIDPTHALTDASIARFTPLIINIGFSTHDMRDGLHFVAHGTGSGRFPHAYTSRTNVPGSACCMFPCIDAFNARCTWDLNVKIPRTVGDALRGNSSKEASSSNDIRERLSSQPQSAHEEREMVVVFSGEDTGRIEDKEDPTKMIFSFSCMSTLSAQRVDSQ